MAHRQAGPDRSLNTHARQKNGAPSVIATATTPPPGAGSKSVAADVP